MSAARSNFSATLPMSSVEALTLHGHAAETIVVLARETPDNLVAMTTDGRSGIGRWVLGSVTGRVVRQSWDTVLVIRAADKAPVLVPSGGREADSSDLEAGPLVIVFCPGGEPVLQQ